MLNKCKTGEVYDTKLKKCRRNVRRKNQAMGKSEKKVGEVLTKFIKKENHTLNQLKRFKLKINKEPQVIKDLKKEFSNIKRYKKRNK